MVRFDPLTGRPILPRYSGPKLSSLRKRRIREAKAAGLEWRHMTLPALGRVVGFSKTTWKNWCKPRNMKGATQPTATQLFGVLAIVDGELVDVLE